MKTVEMDAALSPLADYVRQAQAEPLVVTDNGSPTAIILALPNSDWESVALAANPEFLALIERSRQRTRDEGGISAEEMRRRVLAME